MGVFNDKFVKLVGSTTALIALAACGGGGSGGGSTGVVIGADEEALRLFADVDGDGDPDGDLADLLDSGETVTARKVAAVALLETFGSESDPDGGHEFVEVQVQFRLDGDDLVMIYTPEGGDPIERVIPDATTNEDDFYEDDADGYYVIFIVQDSYADFLAGESGYALRGGAFDQQDGDGFGYSLRFVVGAETQDAALAELGASEAEIFYTGGGAIAIRRADAGFNTYNGLLFGDTALTADFGAGTISGTMDNLGYRESIDGGDRVTVPLEGEVLFEEATFSINGFEGDMSADATLLEDSELAGTVAGSLTYSGAFFGPAADEVGGAISGSATVAGEEGSIDYLAVGHWNAYETGF